MYKYKNINIFIILLAVLIASAYGVHVKLPCSSVSTADFNAWSVNGYNYNILFDFSAGTTTLKIYGLNLSGIKYEGSFSWPPISGVDYGAQARFGVQGSVCWSRHMIVSAIGNSYTWDGRGPYNHSTGFRKYLIQNQRSSAGGEVGNSQYNVEAYIPRLGAGPGINDPPQVTDREYNMFDLKLTYTPSGSNQYQVQGWSRLYKSSATTEMAIRPGVPPWGSPYTWRWNNAINNQTNPENAWNIFYDSRLSPWTITGDYSHAFPYVQINNWGITQIQYHTISWDSIVIDGSFAPVSIAATTGAGGTITPSGNVIVEYDANQTFTIAPDIGNHIADVLVDGSSVGAVESYTFEHVIANHTIYAAFKCELLLATDPPGITSPSGAGWYDSGVYADISTATIVMVGMEIYYFTEWTTEDVDEIEAPYSNSTRVLMDEDKTVSARYQKMTKGTGGKSIGFWINQGQNVLVVSDAVYLNALAPYVGFTLYPREPLGSTPFDNSVLLNFKNQVKGYLRNANAQNMRYMLAAQLLATEINVLHGYLDVAQEVWIDDGDEIFEPGESRTIGSIMEQAITEWQTGVRQSQEYVKNLLDDINNNRLYFIVSASGICGTNVSIIKPAINVSPNPLNKTAMVCYTVGNSGKVSIKLYNTNGRLVKTLVNNTLNTGSYTTQLPAQNLAKGVYILKYHNDNFSKDIKLVIQ